MLTVISVFLVGVTAESGAGAAYCHSQFHKYFEGLGAPEARVNPVERFVFSLLLTKAKPDRQSASLPQAGD